MNKELSLLGIAKKAGRLAVGTDAVTEALRSGRAKLVVLAHDAGANTARRLQSRETSVPIVTLAEDKETLGGALGYANCAAAAICDAGISRAFIKARSVPAGDAPAGSSNIKPKERKL